METPQSQIVIYKDHLGNVKIDVRFDGDTLWLTQDTIATLYEKGKSTVTEHIQHIFQEAELDENSACREFRRTGTDGKKYFEIETVEPCVPITDKYKESHTRYYELEPMAYTYVLKTR